MGLLLVQATIAALETRELVVAEADRPLLRVRFRLDEALAGAAGERSIANLRFQFILLFWCTGRRTCLTIGSC